MVNWVGSCLRSSNWNCTHDFRDNLLGICTFSSVEPSVKGLLSTEGGTAKFVLSHVANVFRVRRSSARMRSVHGSLCELNLSFTSSILIPVTIPSPTYALAFFRRALWSLPPFVWPSYRSAHRLLGLPLLPCGASSQVSCQPSSPLIYSRTRNLMIPPRSNVERRVKHRNVL